MLRTLTLLAVVLFTTLPALAGPMVHHLESVQPRCGQRGTTVEVVLHGSSLHDPREILFYRPGIRAVEVEALPRYERPISMMHSGLIEDKVRCKFVIDADCPLGEHPFRLRTADELTGLTTFHVTRYPVVAEAEKNRGENETRKQAQAITLNTTLLGRMGTDRQPDVDVYRVAGKKGEHLSVEVDSVALTDRHYADLEFDLAVRLLDADGHELARNDDSALHIQDPIASTLLPRDGDYFVEVRQRIARSSSFIFYAAHIGNYHRPLASYPAGGRAGEQQAVRLIGDPAGDAQTSLTLPTREGDFEFNDTMPSGLPMRVSSYANVLEGTSADATLVEQLPAALNGIIDAEGQVDRFRLKVAKGQRWRVRVFGRSLGTPLDPRISITRAGADSPEVEADDSTYQDRGLYAVGRELKRKELLDPSVVWEPRESGDYELAITDMRSLGGPTFVYRVEVEPVRDSIYTMPYSRVIDNVECMRLTNIVIPRGNRWTVNLALVEGQGNRYRGPLEIVARGLPLGVRMTAPQVVPGQTTAPVQFTAESDTPPQVALIELLVRPVDRSIELDSGSQQAFPFMGHSGGAAWKSVVTDRYGLAVTEPAPFEIDVAQPKIPLALNGELALEVSVTRRAGFDEPIEFQADWTPPGVEPEPTVTLDGGKSQARLRLAANGSAKPGKWKVALTATTTGGSYYLGAGRIRASTAMIDLEIAEPYVALKNHPTSIRRGEKDEVVWDVEPKKPLPGEVECVLLGLPKGVRVVEPAPRLKNGDKQLRFTIEANADVLLGQYKELTCEIVVREAGQEIRQRTGTGVLRVDPAVATTGRTP